MATTRLTRQIEASPAEVCEALIIPVALQRWMVPELGWRMSMANLARLVER
jgi:uncharacterized protein YndB with AHSA1/START domain